MTTFSYSQSPSDNYQYWLDPNHILAGTRQKQKAYKASLRDSWWELTFEVTKYKSPVHSCDTYQVGSRGTFLVLKQNYRLPQFLCVHAVWGPGLVTRVTSVCHRLGWQIRTGTQEGTVWWQGLLLFRFSPYSQPLGHNLLSSLKL